MYMHTLYIHFIVKQEVVRSIKISRAQRGKKKMVTVIVGMKTYGEFTMVTCGAWLSVATVVLTLGRGLCSECP